jgi:peptide-methionine (S)-S-oxide reductase
MEAEFRKVSGVTSVVSGFTGGHTPNPTYEEVSSGTTGHAEAVEVTFDSGRVSYEELVRVFWKNIDPLAVDGQYCDHGSQYRTAIFFHDDFQREVAERTKREVEQHLKASVPTEIVKATTFYRAPEGHQRYAERNPQRYARYHEARKDCGRSGLLDEIWAPLPEGGNGQSKEEQ